MAIILENMFNTRPDWQTCKMSESALIRKMECSSIMEVKRNHSNIDGMMDWTLFGRIYISRRFKNNPKWDIAIKIVREQPTPDVTILELSETAVVAYRRWYLLEYRWEKFQNEEMIDLCCW